jgi:hypothetical protein
MLPSWGRQEVFIVATSYRVWKDDTRKLGARIGPAPFETCSC